MTRLRAALRARVRGEKDAGTTIVELTVVMIILAFIVGATVTLANGFERTNAESTNRQDQLDMARVAVERMSKTLRTAVKPSQLKCEGCTDTDAFVRGKDFEIQFYANLDNADNSVGPSRVTYTIAASGTDAGKLIEKVQVPDSATPNPNYTYCDPEAPGASALCKSHLHTQQLAVGVKTDPASPVFSYFRETGDAMPTGGSALTSDQLEKLLSVEIRLTVQSSQVAKPKPTTYIQPIMFPNSDAILRPPEIS